MNKSKSIIGQNIICYGVGIGEIVDVVPMQEGGDDFYKVSFPKDKCINYFSVSNKSKYRILASKEVLEKAIKKFNSKNKKENYKTTQEKINTQKEMLKEGDVIKLAQTLSILNSEKTLHAQISKPYKDTLATFVEEIAFVLQMSASEVYSMLNLKVPKKS